MLLTFRGVLLQVDVMTRRTYLGLEVDELFKLFRADKASTQLAKPVKHVASLTQGPYIVVCPGSLIDQPLGSSFSFVGRAGF